VSSAIGVAFLDTLIPETTAKRVLIVDDEPVIADTLVIILSRAGYHARSAYTAEEALELVPVWHPDLAIIDVILPRMNGVELCIQIKAESPDCRVALFTGASAASDLLAAAPNSFEVLVKPIHPREILAHVSRLLS
jgi:DNA-binding response OmpR family regulator